MLFAWTRRFALGALVLASGCHDASDAAAPAAITPDAGPGNGGASSGLSFVYAANVACEGGGVCAPLSESVPIGIAAATDGPVTLALEGDYADASLDLDQVTTSGGRAAITLHTSSVPTSFRLVARNGSDGSASLAVTVSASGSATIVATPSYTGRRSTPAFLASVFQRSTCADFVVTPPPDTAPWTEGTRGVAIALGVPAGETLAVEVRVGHYAYGCADVSALAPTVRSAVSVAVYDVPLALGMTDLDATFSFAPDAASTSGWQAALGAAANRVGAAFFAGTNDGTTLLDAMRKTIAAPADQAQFDALRSTNGWDAKAATWISSHVTTSVHALAASWLAVAKDDPLGALLMHLAGGATAGTAIGTPSALGSLGAASAGVATPSPFTWTADADDTTHLAGALDLASTPLVARHADLHAAAGQASASDVPSAIALRADCTGLASNLVGAGVSYGTCAATCTADACRAALAGAWAAATVSPPSAGDDVHLALTASAPALVGDHAEPSHIAGGWLGQVSGKGVATPFAVKGDLVADPPR